MATPDALEFEQIIDLAHPHDFLQQGRSFVDRLSREGRDELRGALEALQETTDRTQSEPNTLSLKDRYAGLLHFITAASSMPADCEREGRGVAVADMKNLEPVSLSHATMRTRDLQPEGWPLTAHLIELDGLFAPDPSDRPVVYFVHEGEAQMIVSGKHPVPLTRSAQAALPSNTIHSIRGKATLYVLRCDPSMGGSQVIEHFDDESKKNKCPCGWSYRIPLFDKGWGFSTHRTIMSGVHDATHDGFAGHQHLKTHEIYFTDSIEDPNSKLIVGSVPITLSPGMLVAIPNGTMHTVTSKAAIVQHIFVGKGHKNDDFWTAKWNPLRK